MTKTKLLSLLALASCAISTNRAQRYVADFDPTSSCIRWGDDAALCHHVLQLFVCIATTTAPTTCYQIADLTPKQPAPQPASSPTPPPAKVDPPKDAPAPSSLPQDPPKK